MNAKPPVFILWIILVFGLFLWFNSLGIRHSLDPSRISYSEFLAELSDGQIAEVTLQEQEIQGTRTDGSFFITYNPDDPGLVGDLINNGVTIRALPPERPGLLMQVVASWLPFLVLIGVWIWFMRRSMGSGSGA